ncbi:peptidase S53 propeptide [Burkholderia stagnalis]|uniref:S53 family peptidase n=1 Tax=Burkholderia stagnalis TaxID=1503054 RepID=UPI000F5F2CF4|nr:S53 family serine peptidase [Burkholderia stagnalis]RQY49127.1 peptidase S53 propeptide [Burkholderia stagnalis]
MSSYVTLPGSQKNLLPDSRPAGPVDPSTIASVTVRIRSAGVPDDLVQKAYELATTRLESRNYLTHEELANQYGATKEDLDKIEDFAQQHDLTVVHRSAAERTIVLNGKLGDLLGAFHADVQMYHHAAGTYRGRRGEISLPQELSDIVTGVFGLDTRPKHRAPYRQKSPTQSGPGNGNGVAATEFAKRYNFPQQFDGTGQTIAIIELGGGFRRSDLKAFFNEIGVPMPQVSSVSVDHAGNHPSTPGSADGEVMLDIEVAGAVAPKAKYVVYFAPNIGDQGFLDAISAAIHDTERKPDVISISWGGPEVSTDRQGLDAYHELFAAAASLGITVCAASGDHGTADLDAQHWDSKIHVDHPSSDDLVLGCGGTQITDGKDVVWNDKTPFDVNVRGGGGWASGGGVSAAFPVPSYQTKAQIKPVSIDTGNTGRGVPDIAMNATNYFTRVDTAELPSGGTSAVAPLTAALIAQLNQGTGKNVGFLNPFLYENASSIFNDVTLGTNAIKNTVKGYEAVPGWDACTGLGTPDGTAILNRLGGRVVGITADDEGEQDARRG